MAPHLRLEAEVDASFEVFTSRLESALSDLSKLLERVAPDLFRELIEKPPVVLFPGYQVVPRVLPDEREAMGNPQRFFHWYTWPWTRGILERRLLQLEQLIELPLRRATDLRLGEESTHSWPEVVREYKRLREDHEWIDGLIEHNRLWQNAIATDPADFARGTQLYDLAGERQILLDRLSEGSTDETREDLGALRARVEDIEEELREAGGRSWVPEYLEIENPSPNARVVVAPLYTDVLDAPFLELFERSVEKYWRYEDDEVSFRVDLEVRRLSAGDLYRDSPQVPPEAGTAVSLASLVRHTALFPADGAVLTTGGKKIHVRGRHIILGPEAVAPRTLAHEFGHVLGFRDSYVRGYRNLGEDGYQVLEASPDPEDIMCSSGTGWVLRQHFEELLGAEAPAS